MAAGPAAKQPVDQIFALLERQGHARYGEAVTQLEHGLQTAWLATCAGATDPLVVAGLLHDVGYLVAGELARVSGVQPRLAAPHEALGARWLSRWLPAAVTGPVALHVEAKRFLVASDPTYRTTLSLASKRSIVRQGGPLSAAECDVFQRLQHAGEAVALRRWDDAAKEPGRRSPPLDHYRPIVERLCPRRRPPHRDERRGSRSSQPGR